MQFLEQIRQEFPILNQQVQGHPLVYFDNAATTQKPLSVISALSGYYEGYNANIHRGIHFLAEKATGAFEETRKTVASFLNAAEPAEVIFTYGTTDGINLVAQTYGKAFLQEGDEILISTLEHHSNIVPWQMLCETNGCVLKVIPLLENGALDLDSLDDLITEKTKFVSVVHVSNALGTINPVQLIIDKAHAVGAKVLIDGAQASAHLEVDVQAMDVDFYVFSGHKIYGPTGVGILYGKRSLLEAMPPYRGGGEMIKVVTFEKTTYNEIPFKFEAGTPNIADIVALKAAIDFVQRYGRNQLAHWEDELLHYGTEALSQIEGLRIIGTAPNKIGVISFTMEGIHPQDIGVILDQQGIAVRTGHHCTQPLMKRLGLVGTTRASFAVYNTKDEIDRLVKGLYKVKKFLA